MYLLMCHLARSLDAECGRISLFRGGHEIGYFHSHNIDERFETNLCSTPKRRESHPIEKRKNLFFSTLESHLS